MTCETFLAQVQSLCIAEDYNGALKLLDKICDNDSNNASYCFWRAFALYCLRREHEALPFFEKAQKLGLETVNETPGYYPKSVNKWVERAKIWSPRRIEKNEFEAACRANRRKTPLEAGLSDADLIGLWDNCAYSLEKYVGHIPTDGDIAEIEAELGYLLPSSYKWLIKRQNGGILAKTCFKAPFQRDWAQDILNVESIYGIDREKPYSLCGSTGSRFWTSEWGYPDIGIAICGTESGGHGMIFLDYSDCGKSGEPCVVQIDQESDYELTYLADDFASFVRGLVPFEDEEED